MLRSWLVIASVLLACAVTPGSRADILYVPDLQLLVSHPNSTDHVVGAQMTPDERADETWRPLPGFESLAIDVVWPVRGSVTAAFLDRPEFEPTEDIEDLQEALYLEEVEAIPELERIWDDGLIEDETQFIGQSPTVATTAGDGVRVMNDARRVRRRPVWSGLVCAVATPNVGLMATPNPRERQGGRLWSPNNSGENSYFLDWPWSARAGRNMFYWVAGPPAFVVLAMLSMSVFTGASKR